MRNYIYEQLPAPVPAIEWTKAWECHEHPGIFPLADSVEDAKDRDKVIAGFGAWMKEHRLGELDGETFTIDARAADRYFAGRFAAFRQALTALQELNEAQFIHDHDQVQGLISQLGETFTTKYSDYILWGEDLSPTPMEEFLRKAESGVRYYIGAALDYKY